VSTIDKTNSGATKGVVPFHGINRHYVIQNTIDLTAGAITAADVYQALTIPAGTLVRSVHVKVLTPAVGTTLTMNVGDGGSSAGWIGSTDGKAVAGTFDHSTLGTDARAVTADGGYFYSTVDSLDVVMTTATGITAGPKFILFAECVDFNALPSA
jgi:hypothetical protein